jgi:hypothetical protein
MILDATRSADALAFLRASLTPAEQQWPRFVPSLRTIRQVSIGELRTHPDLVERVMQIAPAPEHVWMLMGAPVLVTMRGAVYGLAFSMRTLAFRVGGDLRGFERVETTPATTNRGRFVLNDEWIAVDPWMPTSQDTVHTADLKALALSALKFVDG